MESRAAIEYILRRLEKEIPSEFYYHSVKHSQDVILRSQKLAARMGVSEEDQEILLTAAAFHDSGFIFTYVDHESRGCELVAEVLPQFGYSINQIIQLQEMIMATKLPQSPKDLLAEILCDADLFYLGGPLYDMISNLLHKERIARGIIETETEWVEHQIAFLENHSYWTLLCQQELNAQKQNNLEGLKAKLL